MDRARRRRARSSRQRASRRSSPDSRTASAARTSRSRCSRRYYSVGDLLKMVTSGTFTDPLWTSWLQKVAELKPYFNDDTNSIPYSEGLARFQSGKAAMVFASPGLQQTIIAMYEGRQARRHHEGADVRQVRRHRCTRTRPGFQVLKFAKNKALAGNFLAFMHTPGRDEVAVRRHRRPAERQALAHRAGDTSRPTSCSSSGSSRSSSTTARTTTRRSSTSTGTSSRCRAFSEATTHRLRRRRCTRT